MRIYLKIPPNVGFNDQAFGPRKYNESDSADWIFVEAAVEEMPDGSTLWPIHWETTIDEINECFDQPEMPDGATLYIEWDRNDRVNLTTGS